MSYTSDFARQKFDEYNLSYSDISSKDFFQLREFLSEELKGWKNDELEFELIPHKSKSLKFDNKGKLLYGSIRVKSKWFDNREAITFNQENQFIGFAGWADASNKQPFVVAFLKWINEIVSHQIEAAFN